MDKRKTILDQFKDMLLALFLTAVSTFVFCWHQIGDKYFFMLPELWRKIGLWDAFCLLWVSRVVLGTLLFRIEIPK